MELLTSGALWRVAGGGWRGGTGVEDGLCKRSNVQYVDVDPNFVYFSPFLLFGQHCIFDYLVCCIDPSSFFLCVRCKTTHARFLTSDFTITSSFSFLINPRLR